MEEKSRGIQLTPQQKKACLTNRGRVIVSAGAGSGKTGVLVERFVRLVREKQAQLDEILTVTFTNKAAREMKERILERFEDLGMKSEREHFLQTAIGTIHSFCARLLSENKLLVPVDPSYRIVDRTTQALMLERVLQNLLEEATQKRDSSTLQLFQDHGFSSLLKGVETAYAKLRSLGISPDELDESPAEEGALKKQFKPFLIRAWKDYEALKRRQALLDHDDLQTLAYDLLRLHPQVLQRLRRKIKFILVDEFQDTNPVQVKILDLLSRDGNDFFVGDKKQAIYGFRHAEVEAFNALEKECAADKMKKLVVLEENFRSRPEVIEFVNRFFEKIWHGDPRVEYRKLIAAASPQNERTGGVEIALVDQKAQEETVSIDKGREAEARWIGERIGRLVQDEGYSFRDIVILIRSTTALPIYQQSLDDAGIPFYLVSGRGFYAQQEIHDVVNWLKALAHPEWDIPLAGFLRSPMVGLSDDALYWCAREAKKDSEKSPLSNGVRSVETIPQISDEDKTKARRALQILEKLNGAREFWDFPRLIEEGIGAFHTGAKTRCFRDGPQRLANLQKLMRVAREFQQNFPQASLEELLDYFDRLEKGEEKEEEAALEEEQGDVVRVMTIHQAKGLEFPVVFAADLGRDDVSQTGDFRFSSDGRFAMKTLNPETQEKEPTALFKELNEIQRQKEWDEKKRLLYVACTRAQEKLILVGSTKFAEPKKKNSAAKWESKSWADWLRIHLHLGAPDQLLPPGTVFRKIKIK